MQNINTVLFDLDGTLIDTAPDMANALNILLREEGYEAMDFSDIRPHVSNGSAALVQLGFPALADESVKERLKKRYLEIYEDKLCVDSGLFPGMAQLLEHIENQQMRWGVVTNKPAWLTDPLMQQIGLGDRAACIISGDTTENRKPHPEPMYLACKHANSQPQNCIYIGDALRDIQAGANAGMRTVVANYGYIGEGENIAHWGADFVVETPLEILPLISAD